ncbi:MAG TPA: hypothetical protein VK823_16825 [Streptosporangiaceae bacterium]|nr:hypothetical protein [Streptosporangiaceae bacterium]
MTRPSDPEDLAVHGIRVLAFPTASRIASRFGLDPGATRESLLDFEARGWARATSFAGSSGWSLTEDERAEDERRLSAELDRARVRDEVARAHASFVPLNADAAGSDGAQRSFRLPL